MAATKAGAAIMRHMLQLEYQREMPALQKAMPEIEITYLTWLELRVMLARTKPGADSGDVRAEIRSKIKPFSD